MSTRMQISFDVPFSVINPLTTVSDISTKDPDSPSGLGYQRVATESRFPKIGQHFKGVIDGRPRVVTPLLYSCRDEDLVDDLIAAVKAENWKTLTSLVGDGGLYLWDGQHRRGGLQHNLETEGLDPLVPVTLYLGMPIKHEAAEFDTINQEAKKMPKSHAVFNSVTFQDEDSDNDPEVRLRRLAIRLATKCKAWDGLVGMDKLNRKLGHVVTLEGLRRCMSLFFQSSVIETHSDDDLFKMADEYFCRLKDALGNNWGSNDLLDSSGNPVVLVSSTGKSKKVRSRVHHLATLAGLCYYGYPLSMKTESAKKAAFGNLSEVDWSEDSPTLAYPAGFAGLKSSRAVFRELLEI